MTTEQIIEAMARAIYEAVNGAGCRAWSSLERWHKDSYRTQARAALTVARYYGANATSGLAEQSPPLSARWSK